MKKAVESWTSEFSCYLIMRGDIEGRGTQNRNTAKKNRQKPQYRIKNR